MLLDDLVCYSEAQPGALVFRGKKGVEDILQGQMVYPDAGVGEVEAEPLVVGFGGDGQSASLGHGLLGILDQVGEGSHQVLTVDTNLREWSLLLNTQRNICLLEFVPIKIGHLAEQLRRLNRRVLHLWWTG